MRDPHGAVGLQASGVSHSFGAEEVLANVGVDLRAGELTALIGPNGAGKSTLLRILQGQLQPSQGQVRFQGDPIATCRHQVTLMPQRGRIDWSFPITALEMVRLHSSTQAGAGAMPPGDALAAVGLKECAAARLSDLSGGQQQRILLAGAISAGRSTLLLDEPCSAMDPPTRSLVLELLLQLRSSGISICLTSHDWGRALLSYDRVIVLDRTVLFDGAPTGIDQALDDLMASRHRCNH